MVTNYQCLIPKMGFSRVLNIGYNQLSYRIIIGICICSLHVRLSFSRHWTQGYQIVMPLKKSKYVGSHCQLFEYHSGIKYSAQVNTYNSFCSDDCVASSQTLSPSPSLDFWMRLMISAAITIVKLYCAMLHELYLHTGMVRAALAALIQVCRHGPWSQKKVQYILCNTNYGNLWCMHLRHNSLFITPCIKGLLWDSVPSLVGVYQ